MNKAELVAAIAEANSVNKAAAETFITSLADIAITRLKAGEEVTLPGIGKLKTHEVAAKKGRNPATGEPIDIPAKTVVKLSVAKELKEAVA